VQEEVEERRGVGSILERPRRTHPIYFEQPDVARPGTPRNQSMGPDVCSASRAQAPTPARDEVESGALNQKTKMAWVKRHVAAADINMVAMNMRICEQFVASKVADPQTGTVARPCRKGPLCRKLHILPDASAVDKSRAVQKFNVPYLSLYTTRDMPTEVHMRLRPPIEAALLPFYKYCLGCDIEEVPVAATTDMEINDIVYIKFTMKDQKEPSALAVSQDLMAAGDLFEYYDKKGNTKKMRVSGKARPSNGLFAHGTDLEGLRGIMKRRALIAGEASPIGVYAFPATTDTITEGYDRGASVVCGIKGAQLDLQGHQGFHLDMLPQGAFGFLRKDTARGCHQYVCHEDCIIIKEIRIKLELLRKFLAEALDAAGYTEMYHEALKDLKRKYQGRPLDVDRAKRGCMKHNLRKA